MPRNTETGLPPRVLRERCGTEAAKHCFPVFRFVNIDGPLSNGLDGLDGGFLSRRKRCDHARNHRDAWPIVQDVTTRVTAASIFFLACLP